MKIFVLILAVFSLAVTVRSDVALCELSSDSLGCFKKLNLNVPLGKIIEAYKTSDTRRRLHKVGLEEEDSFSPLFLVETEDSANDGDLSQIQDVLMKHLHGICSENGTVGFVGGVVVTLVLVLLIRACVNCQNRWNKRKSRVAAETELARI